GGPLPLSATATPYAPLCRSRVPERLRVLGEVRAAALHRSALGHGDIVAERRRRPVRGRHGEQCHTPVREPGEVRHIREHPLPIRDRKSTRLNSSHVKISYAV